MAKRVLIVEDSADIAELLSVRLRSVGVETQVAPDGNTALRLIQEFQPHLVILDLILPVGGGYSVLRKLRAAPQTKELPVVVFTIKDDEEVRKAVEALGVSAYIEKPYQPASEVIETVRRILEIAPV